MVENSNRGGGNLSLKAASTVLLVAIPLLVSPALNSQSETPVFRATATLQSIAVQATDGHGGAVIGLKARDFTLLEDGKPQKIAFFGGEQEPLSLTILIDTGRSMDFSGKLERARHLLSSFLLRNHPGDEIYVVPFTDQVGRFEQLSGDRRSQPLHIPTLGHRGSAIYDALASAICHMRSAKNVKQAIVVITDGLDQHSRLRLEQLINLVRASSPQVFMIGLYDNVEYSIYKKSHKTVTIVGLREIDNPVVVFNRLAKESGAESFFPSSEKDLKQALDRIRALLDSQYTLAYYPAAVDRIRKIDVKVHRPGVKVAARRSMGSEDGEGSVHFWATSCEVSPKDHPYPWEVRLTSKPDEPMVYHEDFANAKSGWPNRRFDPATASRARYLSKGYELYRWTIPHEPTLPANGVAVSAGDTEIAAYGPWLDNFRASAVLQGEITRPGSGVGLALDVNETGYYGFVVDFKKNGDPHQLVFAFLKGAWGKAPSILIPWTPFGVPDPDISKPYKLSVECKGRRIQLAIDDKKVGTLDDPTPRYGLIGFAIFGDGRATVHDLLVEALP